MGIESKPSGTYLEPSIVSGQNFNVVQIMGISSLKRKICVSFTRRRNFPPVRLKVNDVAIPMKEEYKYLGIILYSKLSFRAHGKMVEKNATLE